MFIIPSNYENASQNNFEVSFYLTKVFFFKSINSKCWRVCGKKGPWFTVDQIADWDSHYANQWGKILQKLK